MGIPDETHNEEDTSLPHRLLLVSVPRTSSNLLLKVMNIHNQPNVYVNEKAGYSFEDAFVCASENGRLARPIREWTEPERQKVKCAFQTCLDKLEECSLVARRAGKIHFNKEHSFEFANPASIDKMLRSSSNVEDFKGFRLRMPDPYGATESFDPLNETVLSDEYLRSWRISFIIRHPALAWPSAYRSLARMAEAGYNAEKEMNSIARSFRWTRMLHDWCLKQPGMSEGPPVLDAHDLVHSPQIVIRFCEQLGLDTDSLQFDWEKKNVDSSSEPQKSDNQESEADYEAKLFAIAMSTLEGSNGIIKSKAPVNINVVDEAKKWRTEFGTEIAAIIEKAVWESLPDYEYLKARRVKI